MNNFKPVKILVHETQRIISIKGRSIRTPLEHIITNKEDLDFFLKQLKILNITNYEVKDIIKPKKEKEIIENKTTLERLSE